MPTQPLDATNPVSPPLSPFIKALGGTPPQYPTPAGTSGPHGFWDLPPKPSPPPGGGGDKPPHDPGDIGSMAPPPPAPGTGGGGLPGSGWDGTPAPGDWGLGVGTDWGVPGQIAAYFTSRGVTPAPTSVAYWEDKWNQWGKADPKTFFERLAQADEFGGQNPHPEGGGAGGQFLGSAEGTALFNMLMKTAGEGLNVNPNDPIIKAQTDAYSATQQRQALAAEQQYAASEGAYGSLGPAIGSLQETAGQNTSGFQATLMGNEVAARRQEIQNALSNATSFLTQEQQLALQRELHLLDLQEQAYQFDTTANNGMLQSLTA